MKTFTPLDPREIQQKEKEMLQFLKDNLKDGKNINPSRETINTILNYSKALSIKSSNRIGFIENIMN